MSVYIDGSDCTCLDDEDEHRNNCPASPNYDGPDDDYWCADSNRWYPPRPQPYYDGGRLVRP